MTDLTSDQLFALTEAREFLRTLGMILDRREEKDEAGRIRDLATRASAAFNAVKPGPLTRENAHAALKGALDKLPEGFAEGAVRRQIIDLMTKLAPEDDNDPGPGISAILGTSGRKPRL